jgi:hypothetical protein
VAKKTASEAQHLDAQLITWCLFLKVLGAAVFSALVFWVIERSEPDGDLVEETTRLNALHALFLTSVRVDFALGRMLRYAPR